MRKVARHIIPFVMLLYFIASIGLLVFSALLAVVLSRVLMHPALPILVGDVR